MVGFIKIVLWVFFYITSIAAAYDYGKTRGQIDGINECNKALEKVIEEVSNDSQDKA